MHHAIDAPLHFRQTVFMHLLLSHAFVIVAPSGKSIFYIICCMWPITPSFVYLRETWYEGVDVYIHKKPPYTLCLSAAVSNFEYCGKLCWLFRIFFFFFFEWHSAPISAVPSKCTFWFHVAHNVHDLRCCLFPMWSWTSRCVITGNVPNKTAVLNCCQLTLAEWKEKEMVGVYQFVYQCLLFKFTHIYSHHCHVSTGFLSLSTFWMLDQF